MDAVEKFSFFVLFMAGFLPFLLLLAVPFLPVPRRLILKCLRSRLLDSVVFFIVASWFLYGVLHLSDSDFGVYRYQLLALFGFFSLLCLWKNFGFLGVRALAIAWLMWSARILSLSACNFSLIYLLIKAITYIIIISSIYIAIYPYRARDYLMKGSKDD